MLNMPGLTGNFAIDASLLFSSGHNVRRAMVRAWSNLPLRILVIAAARQRLSQSPKGQTPASIASRIFVIASSAILRFPS